jgi:aromatic-L-amino-acid/L-tryptophan decarboxylase
MHDDSESLDPQHWEPMRELAHRAVDDAFDYLHTQRQRPVWRPTPPEIAAHFSAPLPRDPEGAAHAYQDFKDWVMPWQMGNTHPRFWGWYMGNGTLMGALGEFLGAVVNPNMGGGNHVGNLVESQVVDWCRQIVQMPAETGGLLVSGASMANLVGLAVARGSATKVDLRRDGVASLQGRLRFYASTEVHSCIQKALELLGLGANSLCKIQTDAAYRIDPLALAAQVAADRRAALLPCAVIGTAGTINTGAVDDLDALAEFCAREQLWFHVDGAIGAVLALSPTHGHLVRGMGRADSVAMDLHKWLHVPFEAGCILVRDRQRHRATFSLTPAYLEHTARGLSGGAEWFSDYGVQLSRGFRALKVWLSFKEQGLNKYGRLIDQNIAQARELARLITAEPELELMTPVELNIVCFRYRSAGRGDAVVNGLNEELLVRLHESGVAVPSYTTLAGRYCLRAAIVNHRTQAADLPMLIDAVLRIGRELNAARG